MILMKAELDRKKNGHTELVALILSFKVSVAELIDLLGEGEVLAHLLEMMGRKMVGNENRIVTSLLEKSYLLAGSKLRAGGNGGSM